MASKLAALFFFSGFARGHEVENLIVTDPLNSATCKQPAFRFYRNSTLVLNQLIPSDSMYSTCSWHQDHLTGVEMCGSAGVIYQCALFLDNSCGNGNIDHDGHGSHGSVSDLRSDMSQAFQLVFSNSDDRWVPTSWETQDIDQDMQSYLCGPLFASETSAGTATGTSESLPAGPSTLGAYLDLVNSTVSNSNETVIINSNDGSSTVEISNDNGTVTVETDDGSNSGSESIQTTVDVSKETGKPNGCYRSQSPYSRTFLLVSSFLLGAIIYSAVYLDPRYS